MTDQYTLDQKRDALVLSTDSIRYEFPEISGDNPYVFSVPDGKFVPRVDPHHPFYLTHHEPFTVERYRFASPPLDLGASRLSFDALPERCVNVLRMPVKYPNTSYMLPPELEPFFDLIERLAKYESGFNNRHTECFVHVTIDDSVVESGEWHRYPGMHGDGVQGAKFSQKDYTPVEHSYIFTSPPGTEFCLQPFFVEHLNDARHNLFHEFERQARSDNIVKLLPWDVYLLDPYMVHRTPPITETSRRVFFRLTFSYTELQHPKNTVNPHFADRAAYADRWDIRSFLTTYPAAIPWEMYGFSAGPSADQLDYTG